MDASYCIDASSYCVRIFFNHARAFLRRNLRSLKKRLASVFRLTFKSGTVFGKPILDEMPALAQAGIPWVWTQPDPGQDEVPAHHPASSTRTGQSAP